MKKTILYLSIFSIALSLFVIVKDSNAQNLGQMFMRGSYARSATDREDDLFTGNVPAFGLAGINDRDGWGISTGVVIKAVPKDPWFGQEVWGEVHLEYARFGDGDRGQNVPATIEDGLALIGGLPTGDNGPLRRGVAQDSSSQSEIGVSIFNVGIGPKYRFNFGEPTKGLDWKRLHPFIGTSMMFGVISPPSDDVTYIDIGALVSAGFDYVLPPLGGLFSIGADYRHHFFAGETGEDIDYGSAGLVLSVNF